MDDVFLSKNIFYNFLVFFFGYVNMYVRNTTLIMLVAIPDYVMTKREVNCFTIYIYVYMMKIVQVVVVVVQ